MVWQSFFFSQNVIWPNFLEAVIWGRLYHVTWVIKKNGFLWERKERRENDFGMKWYVFFGKVWVCKKRNGGGGNLVRLIGVGGEMSEWKEERVSEKMWKERETVEMGGWGKEIAREWMRGWENERIREWMKGWEKEIVRESMRGWE